MRLLGCQRGDQTRSAAAKKKGLQKVRVIEIQGVIGGTDVRDRGQGFQNAADETGNFEFVATQSADWSRSKAQELVQNLIQTNSCVQLQQSHRTLRDGSFGVGPSRHFVPGYDRIVPCSGTFQTRFS